MVTEIVSVKKRQFVDALISGSDLATACAAAGRSERTGYRWLADSDVRAVLSEAQTVRLRLLASRVVELASQGLDVLGEILDQPAAPAYVRVAAAKSAIDAALRIYEFVSLEDRIVAIEMALARSDNGVAARCIRKGAHPWTTSVARHD